MFRHSQPRQPEATPPVVHSDQSPDYDDSLTKALVMAAVVNEAVASTALDGETQVIESIPTEEPMPTGSSRKPKRWSLEQGEQIRTIVETINSLETGARLNATMIWGMFTDEQKTRWARAYGTHKDVLGRVKHAIANAKYSGHVRLEHAGVPSTYIYLGKGEGANLRDAAPSSKKRKVTPTAEQVWDKVEDAVKALPNPDGIGHLHMIGTSLEGVPLYVDPTSNVIGTVEFVPLGTDR